MKALVIDRPGRLVVADIPRPEPTDYDALVKVEACGICNSTDSQVIAGTMCYHGDYPAVLGHEGVGTVVAVGRRVRAFRPGMRVTRPFAVLPGDRAWGLASAWGGFAEYGLATDWLALAADGRVNESRHFLLRRHNIVPDGLDAVDAALGISLAEVASWTAKLGSLAGKSVIVLGTGIAGLGICHWAKVFGARRVVVLGRRPERLWAARAVGADEGFLSTPDQIPAARAACGEGADWICEAAGNATALAEWLPALKPGGGAAAYGLPPGNQFTFPLMSAPPDFHFVAPAPGDFETYNWVCERMFSGLLSPNLFWSHEWTWPGDALAAFEAVARREVLKGFLRFP